MRGKLDVVILVRIFLGIIMDRHVKLPFQRSHQMAERNILVNQVAATLHLIKQSIDRPDRYRMRRMRINQTFVRLQDSRLVFACPYIHFDTPLFQDRARARISWIGSYCKYRTQSLHVQISRLHNKRFFRVFPNRERRFASQVNRTGFRIRKVFRVNEQ